MGKVQPLCAVRGLLHGGRAMCGSVINASACGFAGECQHQRPGVADARACALPAEQMAAVVPVADLLALLPGAYYMDPPDGGDVPLLEQLRRMSEDAAKWREYVAEVLAKV